MTAIHNIQKHLTIATSSTKTWSDSLYNGLVRSFQYNNEPILNLSGNDMS